MGIAARHAAAVPGTRLPPGTTVNIGYIDLEDLTARVDAVRAVARAGWTPMPHVSARRLSSAGELSRYLDLLQGEGATAQVFVVGGDPSEPQGPYATALDVIRSGELERHGVRSIGFGGYPEGHPGIPEAALDAALAEKARFLDEEGRGGEIITQLSLDPEAVLAWIARVRDRGIELPIRVGVAGPVRTEALLGLAQRFGARTAGGVAERYGLDEARPEAIVTASRFVEALASQIDPARHGVVGLHAFTFDGLAETAEWIVGIERSAG
ncbi:methylenetetrahydrofolate reductase [Herbiconiux sp. 11R-BC]|uniref:methylenetetrahydrofolate reductase n=1 Tax=Herbiconiux sp. 11R-BC TaxID=3111637 RepID=UPI003C0C0B3C